MALESHKRIFIKNMKNSNLTPGWKKVKLGEVFEMKYGEGLVAKNRKKGVFPVYGSSGIVDYNIKPLVNKEGLIIGRKGNVGSVYYSQKPFFPIDTVYYIESLKIPGDLKFIYYLLKKIPFKRISSDVGVPGLNRDLAYGLDTSIPDDQNEQKRISSILSTFDDKIELNNKIAKTLEDMASILFKEWFIKEVKSENLNVKSSRIKDIAYIKTGNRPGKLNEKQENNFTIPVYGAKEIMGYTNKSLYNDKVILTGRVGTIGEVYLVEGHSWPSDNALIAYPKDDNYFYLLYFLMKRINYLSLNRGSSQPLIAQSDIENYFIDLPEENKIEEFNTFVSKLFLLKKNKENENKKLAEMRDLLLPKLMKGEIRV